MTEFSKQQRQEREQRFGHVRPEIAIDYSGYKLVAVGGNLYYNKRWKFFVDFLIDYAPGLFGREWFEKEIAKAPDQLHPLMQWRIKGMNYMYAQPKLPDGTYSVQPSGFLAAYLTFAYDLYVVAHNGRLDERLLHRLKHPDQFQGARHELFAEATCQRAGFEIEHEDEKDGTRRHAEFTATHKTTGIKVSVEAKSKHRRGVLGQPGTPEDPNELNLRFGKLLNDAVSKNPPHPLVVFLETNLPPPVADRLFALQPTNPPKPPAQVLTMLDRVRKEYGGRDPINLVVLTNHPHHYAESKEPDPRKHLLTVFSTLPLKPLAHPEALAALHHAANIYGNIPNEFPEAPVSGRCT